jgi:subtilisin family serine protease
MKQKFRISYSNKIKYLHAFLITGMLVLFLGSVSHGSAQEAAPTVESTATVTEMLNIPTETAIPIETETAPPVRADAGAVTQVLVKISPSARLVRVQDRLSPLGSVIEMEELGQLGIILIEVPAERLEERIQELQLQTGVAFVEPNYSVQAADVIPNDPGWSSQYGLVAIRAPQGWALSTGSSSVTIAVLDSGVDLGHPDLAGKVAAGYDFVNNDNTPQDDFGHGTHVAGIAAAQGNNGLGVAGVSWGAQIMPVKVLDRFGGGSYANVAAGIVWAVDHGAQVINLSLGGALPSLTLESAVLYAYHKGALLVAASGNGGKDQVLYPARYPQVMAVGATNFTNQPASFSNYGPEVDIAAPGENIYSLGIGGTFVESGTSMSAPYVSGLAAILISFISDAGKVRGAIESSALDVGPVGYDLYSGAGLIQMDSAIALVLPADVPAPAPLLDNEPKVPSNANGSLLPQASPTPSLTLTPRAALMTATTTQTESPLSVTLESMPTLTPVPTPTSSSAPRTLQWQVFFSPYSCTALGLILAGLGLWWFARRRSKI